MSALAAGFSDPVTEAQAVFRAVMNALARPGSVQRIPAMLEPPLPLAPAAGAIGLALFDYETPVWLDEALSRTPGVRQWLHFHTGAPIVEEPQDAAFGVATDANFMPPFERFALGTGEYPDRSTTLIVQAETVTEGGARHIAGPGISGVAALRVAPLPGDFTTRMAANRALFPRGIDIIFTAGDAVVALPRSTRIVQGE